MKSTEGGGARPPPRARHPAGVQARGYLRGGVRHQDRLHVLHLRGGVRGGAHRSQEGDGAGWRPEPHRAGHRVRLLLRARGDGAARGRLRDHHGQLQPGDGVDRLRHVRPVVLRAAHAGRRARDRARRKAVGRDRAVRRTDAAEARARSREERRAHHRHHARHDRHGGGSRALPADAAPAEPPAAAQQDRAHRCRGAGRCQRDRLSARGASVVCAGRPRDGDRARAARARALHARSGQGQQRFAGAPRSLPERRHRGGRRCGERRHRRGDRRRDGAHRAGRRALGRFGVLAAAVLAAGVHRGRAAHADGGDGQARSMSSAS